MEQRYLPSTPQQRLQDLMKEHKITQAVLAKKIGVTESTLSRFINGTKDTLSLDQMISIARIFNVSTDFLLCMTDVPDRKTMTFPSWDCPLKRHGTFIPAEPIRRW